MHKDNIDCMRGIGDVNDVQAKRIIRGMVGRDCVVARTERRKSGRERRLHRSSRGRGARGG